MSAREFLVTVATAAVCMLLGSAIYESVVLAPNLLQGTAALEHARGFLVAATPAAFFRVLSPLTQLLLALAVVVTWRIAPARIRWLLLAALAAAIATDVVTFAFHYPRNDILFVAPLDRPARELQRVAQEWAWGNYGRVLLLVVAAIAAFGALRALLQSTARRA